MKRLPDRHFPIGGLRQTVRLTSDLVGLTWWGRQGSNLRPRDYESPALTTELLPRGATTRETATGNLGEAAYPHPRVRTLI